MNLDHKNPLTLLDMPTTLSCVSLHVLDAILSLFAHVMHRQSCLPSGLNVARGFAAQKSLRENIP